MSSGDMYSEPSYEDVAQEVRNETTPTTSTSDNPWNMVGCIIFGIFVAALLVYFLTR